MGYSRKSDGQFWCRMRLKAKLALVSLESSGRITFSRATRKLVADRAGSQCSFPACNRRTSGPGAAENQVSRDGVAAHIYSASPRGPRGQGRLTRAELDQPENCIWLCSTHGKLLDNNPGISYAPETLHSYKALQEAGVRREVQRLYSPIGWLHEIALFENPTLRTGQKLRLSKLNLIYGANQSGKSALTEWIAGVFDIKYLRRWWNRQSGPIHVQLSYLNPQINLINMRVTSRQKFEIRTGNHSVPFNPILGRFIRHRRSRFANPQCVSSSRIGTIELVRH
jgi:hypothetical protein